MIENPWGIATHGVASVKAMPDLVRVRFRVIRLEKSPSHAFKVASEAVRQIRQTLRRHDIADSAVDRSRLSMKSSYSFGQDRKFLGYECQAAFAVESTDLDDAEQLLVDLVAAGANEIEAVDFDITTKGELRAQARREAVATARRKAELYAEAAGVRLGALVHVDDVDPETLRFERYRAHGSGVEATPADLAPGHVVVSAAVTLGFAIMHD